MDKIRDLEAELYEERARNAAFQQALYDLVGAVRRYSPMGMKLTSRNWMSSDVKRTLANAREVLPPDPYEWAYGAREQQAAG